MSIYTSLGVTVSPKIAGSFREILRTLTHDVPDIATLGDDGSITAIWQDRKHFNEYDSDDYSTVMRFLKGFPEDLYCYEVLTEGYEPEVRGAYSLNFSTKTVYDVYGKQFDPRGSIVSRSICRRRRK